MGSIWIPWVVALLVTVNRLDSSMTQGRDSPEDFVIQAKADCYFTNGTENVQFVVRFIFNLEEYARFDSNLGMFVALTELGQPDAELWNNRPDILARSRASVDALCRHNYKLGAPFTVGRKGFYPGDIKITWFRNGQEQREGVMSTGLIRNGDWTFQTMVMLAMTPELGEVYTCLVDHPSLLSPVSVEWRAQSEYSWRKMLSGIAAFLVGLVFLLVGIVIHTRARKGRVETLLSGAEVMSPSLAFGARSFTHPLAEGGSRG
ncbi:HLA class II histocompatibility antigen, DO beta chain isoform X3 [Balaenoptera ricei]|uniref:HLA class II histocompatibility antigen, DO beta chain isoform X3 n=1 Tax=Balaenoptera ricei TaxID=2746895 RepID=UPI0028BDEB57|nr:HLA class II histocompatibility antigen, DO beta chain isoform X3 [Balaenoptera ricei]